MSIIYGYGNIVQHYNLACMILDHNAITTYRFPFNMRQLHDGQRNFIPSTYLPRAIRRASGPISWFRLLLPTFSPYPDLKFSPTRHFAHWILVIFPPHSLWFRNIAAQFSTPRPLSVYMQVYYGGRVGPSHGFFISPLGPQPTTLDLSTYNYRPLYVQLLTSRPLDLHLTFHPLTTH